MNEGRNLSSPLGSGFSKHTETLVQVWGGFKHSEDMSPVKK